MGRLTRILDEVEDRISELKKIDPMKGSRLQAESKNWDGKYERLKDKYVKVLRLIYIISFISEDKWGNWKESVFEK